MDADHLSEYHQRCLDRAAELREMADTADLDGLASMSKPVIIEAEPPGLCMSCGKEEETRPYGPGGIEVCFDCGMRDEAEAERRFLRRFA